MAPHKDTSSPAGDYTPRFPNGSSLSHGSRNGNKPATNGFPLSSSSSSPYTLASASKLKPTYDTSTTTTSSKPTLVSHSSPTRPLVLGAYVPTVVFFDPVTEDLDIPVISQHAVRLARAGVAGITTQGSNGEAVHLTHSERRTVTRVTRSALDAAGFSTLPIIVGCGAQSTRETIELCHEALESGGDYALVLPPSYYKPFLSTDALIQFFTDVATASPIPILIYNYPGAVSGTDLDSDAIISLANHPNIVGCKLTCGNTGKLLRIAEATGAWSPCSSSSLSASPSSSPTSSTQKFMCLGGSADFTLQALIAGGSGTISGLGNIAPKACARLIDLYASGQIQEARKLQAVVARGDWAAIRGGIIGTKAALQTFFGYGGYARRPLPRWGKGEVREIVEAFEELVELEKSL